MKLKFFLLLLISANSFSKNPYIEHYAFITSEKYPDTALEYLRVNASTNTYAAYMLGQVYLRGLFGKQDNLLARRYFEVAASKNMPDAINAIADGYYSGDIYQKDIGQALKYYEKAAKLGFGPSQFQAGIVLLNNYKTKSDLQRAIHYLRQASKNRKDLGEVADASLQYINKAKKLLQSYK
ncbi:MAG: sel1 repeat family protein [Alphaproteobacteria bacterium]|nr:sel1 repeat family protein [Alphaproteobacteria bacterium]